MRESNISLITF